MKIDANGAVGEADAGSDFRTAHAFDEAKNEGFAVGVGKRTNGIEDGVGFSAGVRGVIHEGSGRFALRSGGHFVELFVGFGATVKVCGAITRDGSEPSGEAGDFAKSVEPGQGLEEDVVYEIVDVGEGNAGKQNPVDHAAIARIEKAEGGAIAALCCANEGVVWSAGFVGKIHGRRTGARSAEF
jgi:hypothetical protein